MGLGPAPGLAPDDYYLVDRPVDIDSELHIDQGVDWLGVLKYYHEAQVGHHQPVDSNYPRLAGQGTVVLEVETEVAAWSDSADTAVREGAVLGFVGIAVAQGAVPVKIPGSVDTVVGHLVAFVEDTAVEEEGLMGYM